MQGFWGRILALSPDRGSVSRSSLVCQSTVGIPVAGSPAYALRLTEPMPLRHGAPKLPDLKPPRNCGIA